MNDASDVWVLGYKTERGGTLLDTRGGGRSEILGGFSYACMTNIHHVFVDEALASRAYEDTALPIGHGQTISQPYTSWLA